MTAKKKPGIDYGDPAVRNEILVRQRREMWTPEQIESLAKHFRLAPGMALLDAGCGFGYCLRTYGPRCLPGGRLVGFDREADLLETAERMAGDEGLGEHAEFHRGDLYEMPFDDDTFDIVLIQVVMCHLADPECALDELIRVAKPGGCVAVFDNAVSGLEHGWDNATRRSVKQEVDRADRVLRAQRGRRKLGRGDWGVGYKIPGWMEARGMTDVDARVNERVRWIAPPYRSPAQQTTLENSRAQPNRAGWLASEIQRVTDELRADGADEATVRRAVRSLRRQDARWYDAVEAETAAFCYGGTFWCIWGFKPRRRSSGSGLVAHSSAR